MVDKSVVSIEELEQIALNLQNKKNTMLNIYDTDIKEILYESNFCLEESGQDYEVIKKELDRLFLSFDAKITDLLSVLVNKIIPSYVDLSLGVQKSFNDEFANEMQSLLNLERK